MTTDRNDVARAQYQYWQGGLTRKEAQPVFDSFSQAINAQADMLHKLDFVIAFLAEKLGVTPEELQAWTNAKLELVKQAEAAKQNGHTPAEEVPSEPAIALAN